MGLFVNTAFVSTFVFSAGGAGGIGNLAAAHRQRQSQVTEPRDVYETRPR